MFVIEEYDTPYDSSHNNKNIHFISIANESQICSIANIVITLFLFKNFDYNYLP